MFIVSWVSVRSRAYNNNNNNKDVWEIVSGIDQTCKSGRTTPWFVNTPLGALQRQCSLSGALPSFKTLSLSHRKPPYPGTFKVFLAVRGFLAVGVGLTPLYCRSAIEWHGVQTTWDKIELKWHEVYFTLDRPEESRALLLVRYVVADGSSIVSTWTLEPRSLQLAACRSRVRVLAVEARCAEAGLGLGIVMDRDRDGAVS
ncbi:hypothetical protein DER45DRAFT_9217 [Fusarium avenaceum]|nr:hypothetical protein DER45DRAFT_9217 [Fusarium avenaceum]